MTVPPKRSRREVEARLVEKAWKDEAFRRALIEDPKGTLERELQVKVPEEVSLTVIEETPTTRYLVLPPAPMGDGGDLSDAQLDAVAGAGQTPTAIFTMSSCFGICGGP